MRKPRPKKRPPQAPARTVAGPEGHGRPPEPRPVLCPDPGGLGTSRVLPSPAARSRARDRQLLRAHPGHARPRGASPAPEGALLFLEARALASGRPQWPWSAPALGRALRVQSGSRAPSGAAGAEPSLLPATFLLLSRAHGPRAAKRRGSHFRTQKWNRRGHRIPTPRLPGVLQDPGDPTVRNAFCESGPLPAGRPGEARPGEGMVVATRSRLLFA